MTWGAANQFARRFLKIGLVRCTAHIEDGVVIRETEWFWGLRGKRYRDASRFERICLGCVNAATTVVYRLTCLLRRH